MTRAEIIEAVQVRLDELSPFDDIEEVPAINYIDKLLNASTDTVFRLLPYRKLPAQYLSVVVNNPDDPNDNDDDNTSKDAEEVPSGIEAGQVEGEWVMTMPDNYIKFGEAWLSGWKRPVFNLADPNTEILQGSKYTMGTPSTPVVLERRWGGNVKLHFFSSPSKPATGKIYVIVSMLPEDCPDLLVDAISWQCASDVLSSLGKVNEAKLAQEKVLTHNL